MDALFDTDVRWAGDGALDAGAQQVADELRAEGRHPEVLAFGGSNARAARGYLACARELEEQAPEAKHVVVAVGSGATMAGLVAGLCPGAPRLGRCTRRLHHWFMRRLLP